MGKWSLGPPESHDQEVGLGPVWLVRWLGFPGRPGRARLAARGPEGAVDVSSSVFLGVTVTVTPQEGVVPGQARGGRVLRAGLVRAAAGALARRVGATALRRGPGCLGGRRGALLGARGVLARRSGGRRAPLVGGRVRGGGIPRTSAARHLRRGGPAAFGGAGRARSGSGRSGVGARRRGNGLGDLFFQRAACGLA